MEILKSALRVLDRTAIVADGRVSTYKDLLASSVQVASQIRSNEKVLAQSGRGEYGPRISYMAAPGLAYGAATLGCWLAGGIAVPLCLTHPREELQYVVEDCRSSLLLSTPKHSKTAAGIAKQCGIAHQELYSGGTEQETSDIEADASQAASKLEPSQASLIIYTSGTTGKAKGALHTHGSMDAQVAALCASWEWQQGDRILHSLPLHHIHGIVNALLCPLAVGAAVEMQPTFSPNEVWKALQRKEDAVTVFMGVPTMYSYLLSAVEAMGTEQAAASRAAASRLRLAVCGSAACPLPLLQRWHSLSGQPLLERYGMTETGMLLSNPYRGERRPGSVGLPLPGVHVKLVAEGELAVRGPNLFKEYWNKPEATVKSFDSCGYFLTGDTAAEEEGYWKIKGRTSTDIIKSGGYKISALHIEDVLLEHPAVEHCAILGAPDEALGEAVAAVVSCRKTKNGTSMSVELEELCTFAESKLPKYQLPSRLIVLDEIPRNAMGKINKKALRAEYFPQTP